MKTENIIGLCDIDWKYAKNCFEEFPDAKRYWDWRKMFDELGDQIDGVMVATPDHTHATIAATALTMGKHVYCQKPLTHSVYESRLLTKLAAKYKVATQMGNQGHNIEGTMQTVEWIQGGVIGDVREVHLWTNRPMWRQGYFDRPAGVDIPSNLNYDVWLVRPLINLIIRRCFISLGVDYGITVQALWGIWEPIPSTLRFGRLIWVCPRKYKLLPPLTIRTICHNRNA